MAVSTYVHDQANVKTSTLASQKTVSQEFVSAGTWKARKLSIQKKWALLNLARSKTQNIFEAFTLARGLKAFRKKAFGIEGYRKMFVSDDKIYFDMTLAGFPSAAWDNYMSKELDRIQHPGILNGLRVAFMAITKKCAYKCEHCFEWDQLNKKDVLDFDKLSKMVDRYMDFGAAQIVFSGGEPLIKFDLLNQLLVHASDASDLWIVSSGFQLSKEKAHILKSNGLTGVIISLDHFDKEKNDAFRGYQGAYDWALKALRNAKEAGLVTALSLCATETFISEENLEAYFQLAMSLEVPFVQLLEPKEVGHYKDKPVKLSQEKQALLRAWHLKVNNDSAYNHYPLTQYHEYHQQEMGCFGAGNRYLYIDTDGDVNPCPFCADKTCDALAFSVEDTVALLREKECGFHELTER